METMYLVCDDCGEAFDSMVTAQEHFDDEMIEPRFFIRPESEAM